jgi:hypothetical protein
MQKMKMKILAASTCLALGVVGSANANMYDWSYTGPNLSASGSFSTGAADSGGFDIVSISGTSNGNAITGLLGLHQCCSSPANDNIFYTSEPHFDLSGLGFMDSGNEWVNIYFAGTYQALIGAGGNTVGGNGPSGELTISPVPEPETYAMMLAGLGLLGLAARRRKQISK